MVTYSIFVAHSINEKDIGLLDNIEASLPSNVQIYVAEWDPQPGKQLSQKIEEEIKKSDALLAILTKRGIRSEWVNQEIGFAKAHNKLIIPVKESEVDGKGFITGLEWVNIDLECPQEAIEKVNKHLEKLVSKKKMEEMRLHQEHLQSNMLGAIAVGTIVVVAIILLAILASRK